MSFSSLITFVRVGRELVFFLSDFSENHFCEQQKKTDKYGLVDGVVRCFFWTILYFRLVVNDDYSFVVEGDWVFRCFRLMARVGQWVARARR